MQKAIRFKLHGGPYRTPRFRYGATVIDQVRGDVQIVGLSDRHIPWPLGKRPGAKARGLIVYGALAKAVRRESNQAVAYWWGVTAQTVTAWRKAIGVAVTNDGTRRLRQRLGQEPWFKGAQRKAWSKAQDPERCARIAAARRGKKRPPHVVAAMIAARLGSRHSARTRRQMSDSHRRRIELVEREHPQLAWSVRDVAKFLRLKQHAVRRLEMLNRLPPATRLPGRLVRWDPKAIRSWYSQQPTN